MSFSAEYVYRILDRYSGPMNKIVRSQKKYIKAVATAQAKTKKLDAAMRKYGKSAMSVGRTLSTRLTMPIAAIGTTAVVSFARLEKGLINVNNLLSRPELKQYGADLERLQEEAVKAGFSIADTNQGLFDTVSALGAGKRGFDTFSVAQKLAIGGATDLGVAVDGLTTLMSVYESDNVTAMQAANALFSAQVKGKTTVEELASGMGNVASTAKMAGVGMNEMLASLSAMTLGGVSTDESVTALNAALLALAKPQKDAAKLMDRMGISYGVANIKAKGLQAIFKEIAVAQKKYGVQKVMEAIPERRALKAIAALVSGGKLGKISEIIAKINSDLKTGDGLMRAFADQNSSMSRKYSRAIGSMTVMWKRFVVLFAPAINKMLEGVAKFVDGFSKIPTPLKYAIGILMVLLGVLGPLLITLGAIAFTVGFITLPILAVAAAFLSVSAAIAAVIANWETLSAKGFWKDLKDWSLGKDPEAPTQTKTPEQELAQEAAIQQQLYRIGQKTPQKVEIGGKIDVESKDGTKVNSNIGSDTGYQFSGAGASF